MTGLVTLECLALKSFYEATARASHIFYEAATMGLQKMPLALTILCFIGMNYYKMKIPSPQKLRKLEQGAVYEK